MSQTLLRPVVGGHQQLIGKFFGALSGGPDGFDHRQQLRAGL
ncbi:MAG: hypothetical protein ABIO40_09205 [Devosia sp.]